MWACHITNEYLKQFFILLYKFIDVYGVGCLHYVRCISKLNFVAFIQIRSLFSELVRLKITGIDCGARVCVHAYFRIKLSRFKYNHATYLQLGEKKTVPERQQDSLIFSRVPRKSSYSQIPHEARAFQCNDNYLETEIG